MWKRKSIACVAGVMMLFGYLAVPAAESTVPVLLYPDGNPVEIILYRMNLNTGRSYDPRDEIPSDAGYVFLESVYDGLWRRDIYVTPDAYNLESALANGGTIILSPGTYYFSARSSIYYDDVWTYTSMDYRLFDAGTKDFVLKGEATDKTGPMAKIITDQFLHIGADPRWRDHMQDPSSWDEIRTVNQQIKNIAFDNTEYLAFNVRSRSPTVIGQSGKANIDFVGCSFSGGGVTFHTVGSVKFRDNVMDNTVYGVSVSNNRFSYGPGEFPADADVLIAGNNIMTQGAGVQVIGNSQHVSSIPKTMKIVDNTVTTPIDGIILDSNLGAPVVNSNIVSFGSSNYYAGGIAAVNTGDGVLEGNEITSTASTSAPYILHGIMLVGSSNFEVRSNKLFGHYDYPVLITYDWLYGTGSTSDSNRLLDNELRKSTTSTGWHILLTVGTSQNVVIDKEISKGRVAVLDYGQNNYIEGHN